MSQDLIVTFHTSAGDFQVTLFKDQAPRTVSNFYNLAKSDFYNGVIFHRVIDGFMLQGGDPTGTGRGGPGYKFKDEFHPSLRHDGPGVLSMANAGPNTNGSQFFVTVAPTPHLDNRHAVFGKVSQGLDVVMKISQSPTDGQDRPLEKIMIKSLEFNQDFTPIDIEKV